MGGDLKKGQLMDQKQPADQIKTNNVNNDFEVLPSPSKNNKSIDKNRVARSVFWIFVTIIIGFGSGWLGSISHDHQLGLVSNTSQAKEIISNQSELISSIANKVSPSVVSIDATGQTVSQNAYGVATQTQVESQGTGIIISSSGYIVTNRHVIPQGVTSVSVVLADNTTINNVSVVGSTSQTDPLDIAFLKINNPPETLQSASLGYAAQVQVGDSVVAIGNALGQFQNTVTSGIISGRGRSVQAGDSTGTINEDLQDLLQTDAPINEGNSGGPLVNINSQVIGINTAIASGTAQNVGFAIPITNVEGLIKGLIATGKIERPYIGVYYVALNNTVAQKYNLSVTSGAYIAPSQPNGQPSIIPGGPANTAGLQVGDIITAVNGSTVNINNSLSSLIDQNVVGAKVNLSVIRGGKQITVPVTIGQEP